MIFMNNNPTLIFFLLFCFCSGTAIALENGGLFQDTVRAQLEELNLTELLSFSELVEREYRQFLPTLNFKDLLGGGLGATPSDLFRLAAHNFLGEFFLSLHLLRQLAVVGILAALLQRLAQSFGSQTVVNLAFGVCFLVLMLVALQSFQTMLVLASTTVDHMVSFMQSLLPLLSTLLITVGAISSSTIFHPLLWGLVGTIASLVHYLLFPLIMFGTAFGLVSHFSTELSFSRFSGLLRQAVVTLLGAFFIVFSGFMVVKGAIVPVADGISLRAAKYMTKTLIPVAGGMFADAMEVVVGGSLLIKNGVGVFGLAIIMFMVATPLMKIWAMILVYKLVGVLLEPICDARVVQILATIESSLTLVFVSLGTVALMFLLSVSILVGIGNLAVFVR